MVHEEGDQKLEVDTPGSLDYEAEARKINQHRSPLKPRVEVKVKNGV